jgi:tartrate-resistant acid phosphatase type 5
MNKSSRRLFQWCVLVLGMLALLSCAVVTQTTLPTVISPTAIPSIAVSPTGLDDEARPTDVVVTLPPPIGTEAPVTQAATDENIPTQLPTATSVNKISFAVIGDYGEDNQGEKDVAAMIKGWNPDFIITVGDNNYPSGAAETIDQRVGQYYQEFISPYQGKFGPGAKENRFFPTLGNHDWLAAGAQPYLDYFELPGNERYYDFTWGPVHFFAIDSDSHEPDGVGMSSAQAQWLQQKLAVATEPWKIVFFHHPPYSSGQHGRVDWMQWPFEEWGASAVLSGHDHTYERLQIGNIPYFINGLGGGPIYAFIHQEPGSQVRYDADYGAMLVTADEQKMTFQFYTRKGELIDEYAITK